MHVFLYPPFHYTHIDEQHPDNLTVLEYVRNYSGDIFAKLFLSAVFERKLAFEFDNSQSHKGAG